MLKIATNSKGEKVIKMSKEQWLAIGKQAGWNASTGMPPELLFPNEQEAKKAVALFSQFNHAPENREAKWFIQNQHPTQDGKVSMVFSSIGGGMDMEDLFNTLQQKGIMCEVNNDRGVPNDTHDDPTGQDLDTAHDPYQSKDPVRPQF